LRNGKLLHAAAPAFDCFITIDKNLPFQQNIGSLQIGVIVIDAISNRLADLPSFIPAVQIALIGIRPGQFI